MQRAGRRFIKSSAEALRRGRAAISQREGSMRELGELGHDLLRERFQIAVKFDAEHGRGIADAADEDGDMPQQLPHRAGG